MDRFGVALGSLFAYEADFWVHFGLTLGSLWAYRRRISRLMHIVSPCVRPKRAHKEGIHIFAALFACPRGPEHSRKTNNPPGPTVFGARLGSLWVSVGDFWLFLSLDDHFEIIVESPWVYEGPFSKNIHFPNRF